MDLDALTDDEQLALVGLAKLIVHADHHVSSDESQALMGLADQLGRDVWNARVQQARERLPSADATYDLAEGITRPEAQQRIFDVLRGLAGADEVVEGERVILAWLAEVWELDEDEPTTEEAVLLADE